MTYLGPYEKKHCTQKVTLSALFKRHIWTQLLIDDALFSVSVSTFDGECTEWSCFVSKSHYILSIFIVFMEYLHVFCHDSRPIYGS